jgi:hypothetical protein
MSLLILLNFENRFSPKLAYIFRRTIAFNIAK